MRDKAIPMPTREEMADRRIEALEARLAEAQKDAERYRWLREAKNGNIAPFTYWDCGCTGEQLDAAIDSALNSSVP